LVMRRRDAIIRLVHRFTSKWTAVTDCRTGYVVQRCRQFTGRKQPEAGGFISAQQ
jgi:hypothetical protein